jgi:thymidylate synthase
MITINGATFADVYEHILWQTVHDPEYQCSPRGSTIKENLNVALVVEDVTSNLYKNKYRSSPTSYIAKELIWYLSGDTTPNYIGKHASLWNRIINPKTNTVNSNYGYLAFYKTLPGCDNRPNSQFDWALRCLISDKDSRQAIMHFNDSSHQFNEVKDFVCTLSCAFHIRNDKLFMTTIMRSQDLILGLPADFAWFSFLYQQMFSYLKVNYTDLEYGSYTHLVHSLHLYENNFDLSEKMLMDNFEPDGFPPLKADLVQADGQLKYLTKTLIDYVINNKKSRDMQVLDNAPLVKWIYEKATNIS